MSQDQAADRHLDEFDDAIQENQLEDKNVQKTKVITINVHRGTPYIQNPVEPEAVVLTALPQRVQFAQKPQLFASDGPDVKRIQLLNDNYIKACEFQSQVMNHEEHFTQTVEVANLNKTTNTPLICFSSKQITADYSDILALNTQEDMTGTQQLQHEKEEKFKEKQQGGKDFDEGGTEYTGKDMSMGDEDMAGTAYTAGTQGTQGQSVQESVGSSLNDKDEDHLAKKKKSVTFSKVFLNPEFHKDLRLAELLVLQIPCYNRIRLYRGQDIKYDKSLDYKQLIRSEFAVTTNKDSQKDKKVQIQLLFTYKSQIFSNMRAVCCDFADNDSRLLLVGYSSIISSATQEKVGMVAIWQPENFTCPKLWIYTRAEITCLKWFPIGKSIFGVGFVDGTVAIYDTREKYLQIDQQGYAIPSLISSNKTGKHTSKVWELSFVRGDSGSLKDQGGKDDKKSNEIINVDEYDNLVSIAADGRVVERSIRRNFEQKDIYTMTSLGTHPVALQTQAKKQTTDRMTIIRKLSAGLTIDFFPNELNYLIGGDDAVIRRASRAYSGQDMGSYTGHLSSIYKVRINQISPDYFLSCSADRQVKIWHQGSSEALKSIIADEHVYTAEWCPFRSTILILGTKSGKVQVWDVGESTTQCQIEYPPIITKVATEEDEDIEQDIFAVRSIRFNNQSPIFAVCYDNGWVQIQKLYGVENGVLLRQMHYDQFIEVENERMVESVKATGKSNDTDVTSQPSK